MRITVLGGCGAWPAAGQACSGFLVEYEGFRVVVDLGYATVPRLLTHIGATEVDAVLISHGHPDHCADLNPLLRARALRDAPPPALPVYAPAHALDAVLALDQPHMLADAYARNVLTPGDTVHIGPFKVDTRLLPHYLPNAGMRLTAGGRVLAYTGDTGPSPHIVELARDADVLIAEATYAEHVPPGSARFLSSAVQAGESAATAGVGQLVLTHLWPDSAATKATEAARHAYSGEIHVADSGLVIDLA